MSRIGGCSPALAAIKNLENTNIVQNKKDNVACRSTLSPWGTIFYFPEEYYSWGMIFEGLYLTNIKHFPYTEKCFIFFINSTKKYKEINFPSWHWVMSTRLLANQRSEFTNAILLFSFNITYLWMLLSGRQQGDIKRYVTDIVFGTDIVFCH
jgi:hypothetical protein